MKRLIFLIVLSVNAINCNFASKVILHKAKNIALGVAATAGGVAGLASGIHAGFEVWDNLSEETGRRYVTQESRKHLYSHAAYLVCSLYMSYKLFEAAEDYFSKP